jgi:hypothetical protein
MARALMAVLPAPGGGGGTINVMPQDVQAAAKAFYNAQNDLDNAWTKLQSALAANAGMAGNDTPATSFNARYAPAAKAAWDALRTSALTLGGISAGLTQTANNFAIADHHSSARPSGPPALFPQEPVVDDIEMAGPSPAIGPGETVWFLPGPLARFWPNAHPDQVRAAASAWHNAADSIEVIAGQAGAALASLEGNDDTMSAIADFWSQVYSPGNARTVLAGAQQICQSLGDACGRYADAIDAKRNDVRNALIGAGIAVGITTIVGVALTVFTGGGSDAGAGLADEAEVEAIVGDVAAETSATVESEVGATIGEDLVATVEAATADAPAVETAEAEVTQVEGNIEGALDKALSDDPGLARLSDSEAATLTRLQDEYPELDFKPSAEERDGEYVDNQGRTYDQMGNPNTSRYWSPSAAQKFYQAIQGHLLKSMDFTVIDLTGFSEQSAADIANYVDSLPGVEQAKIIRIGF